jgi:hypothetical protein
VSNTLTNTSNANGNPQPISGERGEKEQTQ